MALTKYALISLDELKGHVSAAGDAKNGQLEAIIDRVTDEIESLLGRLIVCPDGDADRGSFTEYHTFMADGSPVVSPSLRTLEWPIRSVTTVHEDPGSPRAYGADALLVDGTHYEVVKPKGLIRRLDGRGVPIPWCTGHRAVRVVYVAGYASPAAVPARIKSIALRYAALIWDEQKRQAFGVSGASDSLGNFTRFAPAQLSKEMKATLASERRPVFWASGERDS